MHGLLDHHPFIVFGFIGTFLVLLILAPLFRQFKAQVHDGLTIIRYGILLRLAGMVSVIFFALMFITILQDSPPGKLWQSVLGSVVVFSTVVGLCLELNLFRVMYDDHNLFVRSWLARTRRISWNEITGYSFRGTSHVLTLSKGKRLKLNS
jgi:hypothetical protein